MFLLFLFLTPFPKAKVHYKVKYRFFAAFQNIFVKMTGKPFHFRKEIYRKSNSNTKKITL